MYFMQQYLKKKKQHPKKKSVLMLFILFIMMNIKKIMHEIFLEVFSNYQENFDFN